MQFPDQIKKIVIDGANIAFASRHQQKAKFQNLQLIREQFEKCQKEKPEMQVEIICDASLKYHIDDPTMYELWVQNGIIKQAPAYIKADILIIKYLQQYNGEIALISNDLFRDYPEMAQLKHRLQYGFAFAFNKIDLVKLDVPKGLKPKSKAKSKKSVVAIAVMDL